LLRGFRKTNEEKNKESVGLPANEAELTQRAGSVLVIRRPNIGGQRPSRAGLENAKRGRGAGEGTHLQQV